ISREPYARDAGVSSDVHHILVQTQAPSMKTIRLATFAIVLASAVQPSQGQPRNALEGALRWRSIWPYAGGRGTAVAGIGPQPMVYYMGSTGGGVWKTEDAGVTWNNVSDGYFHSGSVGAISVSQSNPNTVYVGMGEACLRGNLSSGDGVYKSTDAGRTWRHIGLPDSSQVGHVRIHPTNPDIVFVAAIGHPYGPSRERGVFRTDDRGRT